MRYLIVCISLILVGFTETAQAKTPALAAKSPYYGSQRGFDPERLILGGNMGMNFIKNGYSFYFAPTVGYRFTNRFHMGSNLSYLFYQEKFKYTNSKYFNEETYRYRAHQYSTSLFMRLFIAGPLFIHTEPGLNFYKTLKNPDFVYDQSTGKLVEQTQRDIIPSVLTGAGFAIPLGGSAAFVIYGMYDVLQNPQSPYYGLPIIRGGFAFGMF